MTVQIERWGHHYWVVYYDEYRNRVDEAGPFEEPWEAQDVADRA